MAERLFIGTSRISAIRSRGTTRNTVQNVPSQRVATELHVKGIKLTRQYIRPLLSSSDYLNLEEGRTALREVRRTLGL